MALSTPTPPLRANPYPFRPHAHRSACTLAPPHKACIPAPSCAPANPLPSLCPLPCPRLSLLRLSLQRLSALFLRAHISAHQHQSPVLSHLDSSPLPHAPLLDPSTHPLAHTTVACPLSPLAPGPIHGALVVYVGARPPGRRQRACLVTGAIMPPCRARSNADVGRPPHRSPWPPAPVPFHFGAFVMCSVALDFTAVLAFRP